VKIVVLNESFLEPEHISKLESLGEVKAYNDTSSREQAVKRLDGADVAVGDCFLVDFNSEFFKAAEGLKLLVVNATGFDRVDIKAASDNHVLVAHVPHYSTEAVAEFTVGLLLTLVRKIPRGIRQMQTQVTNTFDPTLPGAQVFEGFELKTKTLGIIGFGSIGRRTGEIAEAFGMKVIAYNRTAFKHPSIAKVTLDELLAKSDVISLHMAAAPDNAQLIDRQKLALVKPSAVLICTAYDGLINSSDLYDALSKHRIAGAALDVLADSKVARELVELDNVIATPHIAFYTQEALRNLADTVVENVAQFALGSPKNIVNDLGAL
jgi:lactate dehydrogenase-like 2-hydroxyacid dehydrogenase